MEVEFWGRAIDSVVMLTWSVWNTEPRSNRYHFATGPGRAGLRFQVPCGCAMFG